MGSHPIFDCLVRKCETIKMLKPVVLLKKDVVGQNLTAYDVI